MDYAEAFLRDQIPPVLRSLVPTTLKTAYDAVALLVRDEPILDVTSAKDNAAASFNGRWTLVLSDFVRAGNGRSISDGATSNGPLVAISKFFLHIPF